MIWVLTWPFTSCLQPNGNLARIATIQIKNIDNNITGIHFGGIFCIFCFSFWIVDNQRLSKRVYQWDRQLNDSETIKTWSSEVKDILHRNGLGQYYNHGSLPLQPVIKSLKESLLTKDQANWKSKCLSLPKLRTFNIFI